MASFFDQAGGLWARGAMHGKVVVGLDYGHAGQMRLDEITGGSPYGATTIAGGDGSRKPTENQVGDLLGGHDHRRVGVSAGDHCRTHVTV